MTSIHIRKAAVLQWNNIDFETSLTTLNKTLYYKTMDKYETI